MKLSKRLEAIHQLIPDQSILVDIGTDHGWLIIKAILTGKAQFAYGLDIADGPLEHARNNISSHNLEGKIELLKLNGVQGFTQDADTFVIAGLGAETIWDIISSYSFSTSQVLIIQSNTDHYWLRGQLADNGFTVTREIFLIERKKPVFIMVCVKSRSTMTEKQRYLGSDNTLYDDRIYLDYLRTRVTTLQSIESFNPDVSSEIKYINELLNKGSD